LEIDVLDINFSQWLGGTTLIFCTVENNGLGIKTPLIPETGAQEYTFLDEALAQCAERFLGRKKEIIQISNYAKGWSGDLTGALDRLYPMCYISR
jgi:hypothetical protein